MRGRLLVAVGTLAALVVVSIVLVVRLRDTDRLARSPYVADQDSPLRGLSAQEIDDLLNGRGAGYARTAELNGYPGPRHVLDLKKELGLSSHQVEQIQAVFEQMQAEARRKGQEIVQREAQLSAAFAGESVSAAEVQEQTGALGLLYGELRATHLRAHLQITPLLSAEQIARYNALRGYTSTPGHPTPGRHQHPGP